MAVLIYQLSIFTIIIIGSFFGKKVRNILVVLAVLFTIINVFMPWLIAVQLFTVFFAFKISQLIVKQANSKKERDGSKISLTFIFTVIIICVTVYLAIEKVAKKDDRNVISNSADSPVYTP